MNPKKMRICIKGYELKIKEQDKMNWYLGLYIKSAIDCCLDTKGKAEYPKLPVLNDLGLSQEEIDNREIQKMIEAEEAWIRVEKARGLEETKL